MHGHKKPERKKLERKKWYKLDNAALLYPAVATSRWCSIFRVSVELSAPVDPALLEEAVRQTLPRFPALKVRIRSGLFWHYLEEIQAPVPVFPEAGHPCMPFRLRSHSGYLFRVLYRGNRISAEFFHVLTDGFGGMTFLKTLTVQYLRLAGHPDVQANHGALSVTAVPDPEETRDMFCTMDLPHTRVSRDAPRAWHFPATKEIPHTLHLIAASMSTSALLDRCHALGVTVTEYLVSAMLYVAQVEQISSGPKRLRPVRVSVPINMRRLVSTRTLRNFSTFINPGIDPALGEYTFEEICRSVRSYMAYYSDPKLLKATIATNVADEKHFLIRLVPLFIKNWCISSVYHRAGEKLFTSTLSNLGRIEPPTGTEDLIRSFEMCLGTSSRPLWNAACCSCGDSFRLILTGTSREKTLPAALLRFLVSQGIPVTVQSNDEE